MQIKKCERITCTSAKKTKHAASICLFLTGCCRSLINKLSKQKSLQLQDWSIFFSAAQLFTALLQHSLPYLLFYGRLSDHCVSYFCSPSFIITFETAHRADKLPILFSYFFASVCDCLVTCHSSGFNGGDTQRSESN